MVAGTAFGQLKLITADGLAIFRSIFGVFSDFRPVDGPEMA
jgi:hypothetical protein